MEMLIFENVILSYMALKADPMVAAIKAIKEILIYFKRGSSKS